MKTLTQLQQNRRIVQDFTLTTLAGIPGFFAGLTYMASLRDLSSGRYEHAGLAALYLDEALQQAIKRRNPHAPLSAACFSSHREPGPLRREGFRCFAPPLGNWPLLR
jgi:hypothetical protein